MLSVCIIRVTIFIRTSISSICIGSINVIIGFICTDIIGSGIVSTKTVCISVTINGTIFTVVCVSVIINGIIFTVYIGIIFIINIVRARIVSVRVTRFIILSVRIGFTRVITASVILSIIGGHQPPHHKLLYITCHSHFRHLHHWNNCLHDPFNKCILCQ